MILDELSEIITERKNNPVAGSYVTSLFLSGKDRILKKIGEEAAEVIIASKTGAPDQLIREIADLWFHCMVLMSEEGISHRDVFDELTGRRENSRGEKRNV